MLACEVGISASTFRRLKTGEPSTLESFLRVALALDLDGEVLNVIPPGLTRPIERVSHLISNVKYLAQNPKELQLKPRLGVMLWVIESKD